MVKASHIGGIGSEAGAAPEVIDDFLGSAQVFALAFHGVFEEALLEEIAAVKISLPQMRVLKLLAQPAVETVSDIAAFLGVSNAAASKMIDRLVRRDLLKRTEGEEDRRASELGLTRSGQRLVEKFESARWGGLEAIFSQFSPSDLHRAAALLDRLTLSVVNHSARPAEVCLQCRVFGREKCVVRESQKECFYLRRKRRKDSASSAVPNAPEEL